MNDVITFETRDEFNRRPFAERLIHLLKTENNLFPISIDGAWGVGKTEFCKKTVYLINDEYSESFVAEYFDAFFEDRYNDPLTSILSKLYLTFGSDEERKKTLGTITKVVAITAGQKFLDYFCPPVGQITKDFQSAIKEIKEQTVKENFETRSNLEKYLSELKKLITEVAGDKTFVLFIDELDRCRPDYALHLLEVVKHVFNMPKLKIIFVINSDQLIEIIKHSYGNNEQIAKRYLDKFFQLQIKLPNVTRASFNQEIHNSITYLDMELRRYGILDFPFFKKDIQESGKQNNPVLRLLEEFVKSQDLSFRDVEKITKYLYVYLTFDENLSRKNHGVKLISIYALLQFVFNGVIYRNYVGYSNPFKDHDDWLIDDLPEYCTKIPMRHILYSMLYTEDNKFANSLFGEWSSDMDMNERRNIMVNAFRSIDNLLML